MCSFFYFLGDLWLVDDISFFKCLLEFDIETTWDWRCPLIMRKERGKFLNKIVDLSISSFSSAIFLYFKFLLCFGALLLGAYNLGLLCLLCELALLLYCNVPLLMIPGHLLCSKTYFF